MSDNQSAFVGSIPEHYDRNLGPIIFTDYAADIARRAAAGKPTTVLETAAGTGIVTRALRDHLAAGTRLTATDLNEPMLDVARTNPPRRTGGVSASRRYGASVCRTAASIRWSASSA
jgi:ubiquinone/menaquinone biosynthesis C-methylase UbiE